MPRLRRLYEANTAYFLTSRMRTGLPLVPDDLINSACRGIIGRAQELYEVTLCSFVMMANHMHYIVLCKDPNDLASFDGFIKGEIARTINKLSSSSGEIWDGRTDARALRSAEDILDRMSYILTNPQRARLVDRIEDYPGISSWNSHFSSEPETSVRIPVSLIPHIPQSQNEYKLRQKLFRQVTDKNLRTVTLQFKPFEWLKYHSTIETRQQVKLKLLAKIREIEARLKQERPYILGSKKLKMATIYRKHVPKKKGRRAICFSGDPELRKQYQQTYKDFCRACSETLHRWRQGDFVPFPIGGFPPNPPILTVSLSQL